LTLPATDCRLHVLNIVFLCGAVSTQAILRRERSFR
jgi:hypothetical protein